MKIRIYSIKLSSLSFIAYDAIWPSELLGEKPGNRWLVNSVASCDRRVHDTRNSAIQLCVSFGTSPAFLHRTKKHMLRNAFPGIRC